MTAKETAYSKAISNTAILGVAPELICDNTCNIGKVVLKFEIGEGYTENVLGLFPDVPELQGIKRLTIFKYFEDMNMLLPIETKYDEETNTIYTEVDELGTYCVMDLEIWLSNMGILDSMDEEPMLLMSSNTFDVELTDGNTMDFSEEDTRISFSEDAIVESSEDEEIMTPMLFASTMVSATGPVTVQTPVDVVFLFQMAGDSSSDFTKQKEMIKTVSEKLFNTYSDVRIYIIGYKEDEATFYFQTKGSASNPQYPYMTNIGEVNAGLAKMNYKTTSVYCNRGKAFSKMRDEIEFRNTAGKFVFQIMNGGTDVGNGYFSELGACASLSINYSEISLPGYEYLDPAYGRLVSNAIANTKGLDLVFGSTTGDTIYNHIVKYVAPATVKYNVIIPTKWEPIELDDILSPDNGANSDTDSLTDWEEVDTESGLITWDAQGNIQLPTFEDFVLISDKQYVADAFEHYKSIVPQDQWIQFSSQEVLPIHSNPCDEDSDKDGFTDDVDPHPMSNDITFIELKNSDYININYTGAKSWVNQISYGGYQGWFENFDNERYTSIGCGLLSISDLVLYLASFDSNSNLNELGLYDEVNGYYNYNNYMDYAFQMGQMFPTFPIVGSVPAQFSNKLEKYLNDQFNDNYSVKWMTSNDKENCYNNIKNMIDSNIPVMFSYDSTVNKFKNNFSVEKLPQKIALYKSNDLISFTEDSHVDSHYMVITGIVQYDFNVLDPSIHRSTKKTLLQVSSWGQKYYIDFDVYAKELSLFTNILKVTRN